eukprot:7143746-Pyramimonas_sp.AAC.1
MVVIPDAAHPEVSRLLYPAEMFQLQGWVENDLDLSGLSVNQATVLAGNMISVPCIGAILASVLAAVDLNKGRAFF